MRSSRKPHWLKILPPKEQFHEMKVLIREHMLHAFQDAVHVNLYPEQLPPSTFSSAEPRIYLLLQ